MDAIENKVAKSGLITLDLAELKPKWEIASIDISQQLVEGLMLREKDFRAYVRRNDWSIYQGKNVNIYCSTDAIVPTWAYMLMANRLSGIVEHICFGSESDLLGQLWTGLVTNLDLSPYRNQRVIIKGCSNEVVSETVYMTLASRLTPVVKSLMFGEPCSTVPIYKR